ncbi:MAG: phosphate acetyltransferase [Bacteroidetes bacterium RIFOXYA12_FULL_35_11]|nr:MAG: phosphate acetyltransferase [Bacteroidetes bacterium GWF2_35_48]OFY81962.1 MAG: phosphate acetyltransferase [Bacteroidetes bacterium RIFOXYA12_FULL_35_11]OFY96278.1 MAG: phosphate acetyltransferase [Bacteroidetes bacterium RIFOXYB2_FULL_35_7]OFZ05916.1 MAG: phosphate acetyltransferase [Bacteroidetes bacterium RIFOXYC12_FULL_35_7]HBX52224.1 phosphate acetyltransferase [Bacteroidales bacterium]
MDLMQNIKENAKKRIKRIVLPEGTSERTVKAADIILKEKIADLILLGNIEEIAALEKQFGLDLSKAEIIDPKTSPKRELYIEKLMELRKSKGLTKVEAGKLLDQEIYWGPMMIFMGDADGEVSGAEHTTADTVRPALQIVKTTPGISVVSGAMVMVSKKKELGQDGVFIFADVAITPNPTAEQLAEIAICSAETAKMVAGIEMPRVALLSFSTKGSAEHELADKVIKATALAKERRPDLHFDGELQADAALIEKVGQKKAPGSPVAGLANVLVFPDLQAGNIGYKLVERLGDAEAVGPVLQGLGAPINDLSRGCSVSDIVNLVAITSSQVK